MCVSRCLIKYCINTLMIMTSYDVVTQRWPDGNWLQPRSLETFVGLDVNIIQALKIALELQNMSKWKNLKIIFFKIIFHRNCLWRDKFIVSDGIPDSLIFQDV